MSKKKNVFVEGPISPEFIANMIAKHQSKSKIGAHNVFMGQVRADVVSGKTVSAIDFSTYQEMAEATFASLREDAFDRFDMTCMHIKHSLGTVNVGELCFCVFVSAPHRTQVYEATEYIVDRVKNDVPIFGKEVFGDGSHQWKENRP